MIMHFGFCEQPVMMKGVLKLLVFGFVLCVAPVESAPIAGGRLINV